MFLRYIFRLVGPDEIDDLSLISPKKESFQILAVVKASDWIHLCYEEHLVGENVEKVKIVFGREYNYFKVRVVVNSINIDGRVS